MLRGGADTRTGDERVVASAAARALLADQAAILERAARGHDLPAMLDDLCRMVEDGEAGTTCTVLLLEGDSLRHGAAPGMPRAFTEAIDGEHIGPDQGSCGAAAYLAVPVYVDDIATDPRWRPWRDLALGLGLRACWSVPVVDDAGTVLATFAAYCVDARMPTPDEEELLAVAAHLAAILIAQDRSRERLQAMTGRLERVNAELVRISHQKDDFLSLTSHELRTPLTPMTGMLDTLLGRWDELPDRRRRELVEVVARHARRMHLLVDDLLTMAGVTSGSVRAAPCDVDVHDAVEEAIVSIHGEGRTIVSDVPAGLVVRADPDQLQQILINHLSNAVKYAPTGPVRVTARPLVGEVEVRVLDRGPGIGEGFVEHLYEPFRQVDTGDRRTARGTGLGLAVVRALSEANGGRAWYEPRRGGGSAFCVAFPAA